MNWKYLLAVMLIFVVACTNNQLTQEEKNAQNSIKEVKKLSPLEKANLDCFNLPIPEQDQCCLDNNIGNKFNGTKCIMINAADEDCSKLANEQKPACCRRKQDGAIYDKFAGGCVSREGVVFWKEPQ